MQCSSSTPTTNITDNTEQTTFNSNKPDKVMIACYSKSKLLLYFLITGKSANMTTQIALT